MKTYKMLSLIDFILFFRSNVKLKQKYYLKYNIYFLLKNKFNYVYESFLNYFILSLRALKKNNILKKSNKKLKFSYLCKRRKKFSRKLRYIKYSKKRKYRFI